MEEIIKLLDKLEASDAYGGIDVREECDEQMLSEDEIFLINGANNESGVFATRRVANALKSCKPIDWQEFVEDDGGVTKENTQRALQTIWQIIRNCHHENA